MKKTVVYLLIATLLFSLTGCIGLSKKHGFGELIILGDNMTREADSDQGETEPQPLSEEATVTIDGDTKKLGEKFTNLRTGTYTAKIQDGQYAADVTIKFENVNKTVTLKPKALLKKLPFNAWKFIFDPAKYEVTVEEQVHLVGEMNGWDPANLDYSLIKKSDGIWSAVFDVEEGQQFKFMYDSTDWGDGNDIGDDIGDDGGNITIGTNEEVVTLDF